jgi:integrase
LADTRYLKREYNTWMFVHAIPRDLRGQLRSKGKKPLRLIVKSLGTTSLKEAQQLRNKMLYETQRMFARVRGEIPTATPPINPETGEADMTPEQANIMYAQWSIIDELEMTSDPLERVKLEQQLEDHEQRMRELKGEAPWTLPSVGRSIRFSVAAEAYLAERQRDRGTRMAESSLRSHRAAYRLFTDYAEDPSLGAIDRRMVSGFLDTVSRLDPGWGKHADVQSMRLKDLVRRYGVEKGGLSNNTLNHYVSALRSLFVWCRRRGDVTGDNPFSEQSRKIGEAGWVPYERAETKKLLAQAEDPLRWYVLIGLYSGMRLGEICSAKIEREHGVYCFNITAGKTKNARRKVPVHSELLREGILDAHYRTMSSAEVTNKFNKLRQRIGLNRDRLSFHSTRKSFTTALDQAAVATDDAAALLGHKRAFSWSVYSSGPGLQRLRTVVEQVRY